MIRRFVLTPFLPLLLPLAFAQSPQPAKPRLVVVISIDQFRADYLERFAPLYLPPKQGSKVGGFNYLKTQGAWYTDAHYLHVPTATGPGHSVILTGSVPALNGIVGNEWFDRTTGKGVYCVDDAQSTTIGGNGKPMSPRNLVTTTVGDELKMATNGRGRVVGIAIKDRASILLAGHAADTVIWFDTGNGAWVTSSYYASKLPAWVTELNARKLPDADLSKTWTPSLPANAYGNARVSPERPATQPIFTHPLASTGSKYSSYTMSPMGQQYVFDTVKLALDKEALGQDDVPDVLAINLSTNDYIGHAYGPNSPEVLDISVVTDRLLSDLFNTLDAKVPGGLARVCIAVTADHGVLPVPEEARKVYRLPEVRQSPDTVVNAVQAALSKIYGDGEWVVNFSEPHLYLNRSLLASKGHDLDVACRLAADAAREVSGIAAAFTRRQILDGQLPPWPWAQRAANGFYEPRSGDLLVLEAPGVYFGGGTGTGHGSAWAYDTHVPLLLVGPGVRAGRYGRSVSISDLAPTLSQILGIEQPSGSVGTVLHEAVDHPLAQGPRPKD